MQPPLSQRPGNGFYPNSANGHGPDGHASSNGLNFTLLENIEAEQSVLGAMLIEPTAIDKAQAILNAPDFSRTSHQILFASITSLHAQSKPADIITLPTAMGTERLAEIGGMTYLTSLYDATPTAANVEHYARIVEEVAIQRQLAETTTRFSALASREGADTEVILSDARKALDRLEMRKAGLGKGKRPLAQCFIDLADVPPPPAELPYLWGPYLNQGAAHWLTGITGLGKSTLLYNITSALIEGRYLWGIECQPQRILYLDMESGDRGRSMKVQRLFRDRERPRGQLFFARDPIPLPERIGDLVKYAQDIGASLVIFDTARRCFKVKDENDNAEVYNTIVPCLDALKTAGVATLTLGHPPKNGGFGARGAGAQEDAGDINLALRLHKGEINDPDAVLSLTVTKNRLLGVGIPPLYLRRIGGDQFEIVDALSAGKPESDDPPSKLILCAQALTDFLSSRKDFKANYTALLDHVKDLGLSKGTMERTLDQLAEENTLTKIGRGVWGLTDHPGPGGDGEWETLSPASEAPVLTP